MRPHARSSVAKISLLMLPLLTCRVYAGDYTFIRLGQAGEKGSIANGINDADQVVGSYVDSSHRQHGFVWANGTRRTVNAGDASRLNAINFLGVATGTTTIDEPNTRLAAFTYDVKTGQETIYDVKPQMWFEALAINNAGYIGGGLISRGMSDGFEIIRGVAYLRSGPGTNTKAEVTGISNDGRSVGQFYDVDTQLTSSFIYKANRYSMIGYPGATQTYAQWIRSAGTVGGSYVDSTGAKHGFTQIGGTYASYSYPNATATSIVGLTAHGVLVGEWTDDNGVSSGFVKAGTSFYNIAYPGATGTFVSSVNDHGDLVGYYTTSGNVNSQAFVALCSRDGSPCTH